MKYFYVWVTTQYDGYEWGSHDIVAAPSEAEATKIFEKIDYTHDNGVEVQKLGTLREISKGDFDILSKYL